MIRGTLLILCGVICVHAVPPAAAISTTTLSVRESRTFRDPASTANETVAADPLDAYLNLAEPEQTRQQTFDIEVPKAFVLLTASWFAQPVSDFNWTFTGSNRTLEIAVVPDPVPTLGNTALPDFRGPEALARRRRNLIISLVVLTVLLMFAAALVWHIKSQPKPPPPPPVWYRKALREMEELRRREIWLEPDVDAAAVALSDILRHYIEGRFDIHAPELTTEEFLLEAQEHAPWPEEEQTGLREFFLATDRIKFAGDRPGRERLDGLMAAAQRFVDFTADREEAA